MIEAIELSKRLRQRARRRRADLHCPAGCVTGFLGPNGAGKSTTMRMILGLDRPTAGRVTVMGQPYGSLHRPLHQVGAVLDVRAMHSGRSAYHHLLCLAQSNGIGRARVRQVLDIVGLDGVARRRAGKFSLGMSQRLGLAAALLGDPPTLICDEPVNGLDPDGILWIRTLLRGLAAQGRTVFVSSHLMSEMALTADHLIVIGRGRLLADAPTADIISASSVNHIVVRSPHATRLAEALRAGGATVTSVDPDGATRRASGHWARLRSRRRNRRLPPAHAALAHRPECVARGGVYGAHQGQRRLSHPGDHHDHRCPGSNTHATIGFANLARSEWTKLRSVRSTYWAALGALVAAVAVAAIICARMASLINDGKSRPTVSTRPPSASTAFTSPRLPSARWVCWSSAPNTAPA